MKKKLLLLEGNVLLSFMFSELCLVCLYPWVQIVNQHLLKDLTSLGLWNDDLKLKLIAHHGSVQVSDLGWLYLKLFFLWIGHTWFQRCGVMPRKGLVPRCSVLNLISCWVKKWPLSKMNDVSAVASSTLCFVSMVTHWWVFYLDPQNAKLWSSTNSMLRHRQTSGLSVKNGTFSFYLLIDWSQLGLPRLCTNNRFLF